MPTAAAAQRVTDDGGANEGSFDGDPAFSPDGTQHRVRPRDLQTTSSLQIVAAPAVSRTTLVPPGRAHPRARPGRLMAPGIAFVSRATSIMVVRRRAAARHETWSRRSRRASVCGCGGPRLVARRHAARRRRRRRHLPGHARPSPASLRLAIRVALRRVPVVLTRRHARSRSTRAAATRSGRRRRSWPRNVDGTNIRTLSTVPFRQSVHPTWQPA